MAKAPSRKPRDKRRMIIDILLTAFGIVAFVSAEVVGLHIAAATAFGMLALWHVWSQRALLKTALKRAVKRQKEPRPLFQALNAALVIAVVATFITGLGEVGIGIAAGHEAFANASLLLVGAHVALSWRRILMLVSGGKLGKRSRSARPARQAAPAAAS